jgi:hypothetical protein
VLHTSQFTDPAQASGRHVLVVGYGKSSCDVANAIAARSASTTMVVRHLIWKIPKRIGNVLNFKHLFLNRLGEGLFPWMELKGFEAFLHGSGLLIRKNSSAMPAGHGAGRDRPPAWPQADRAGPWNAAGNHRAQHGQPRQRRLLRQGGQRPARFERDAEIVLFAPGRATLSNGRDLPADLVICGTGWHQRVDFLPDATRARVTDRQGNFRLYRSMVPLGVPRLLFNGYNSSFFCQLNAEMGAIWIAALLTGRLTCPMRRCRVPISTAGWRGWMRAPADAIARAPISCRSRSTMSMNCWSTLAWNCHAPSALPNGCGRFARPTSRASGGVSGQAPRSVWKAVVRP